MAVNCRLDGSTTVIDPGRILEPSSGPWSCHSQARGTRAQFDSRRRPFSSRQNELPCRFSLRRHSATPRRSYPATFSSTSPQRVTLELPRSSRVQQPVGSTGRQTPQCSMAWRRSTTTHLHRRQRRADPRHRRRRLLRYARRRVEPSRGPRAARGPPHRGRSRSRPPRCVRSLLWGDSRSNGCSSRETGWASNSGQQAHSYQLFERCATQPGIAQARRPCVGRAAVWEHHL